MQIPKILAQATPAVSTLTDAYTVPAATRAFIRRVVFANRVVGATTFRLAFAVAGAADAPKQYTHYDYALGGLASVDVPLEVHLEAGDIVRVYSPGGNVSVTIFGIEER